MLVGLEEPVQKHGSSAASDMFLPLCVLSLITLVPCAQVQMHLSSGRSRSSSSSFPEAAHGVLKQINSLKSVF